MDEMNGYPCMVDEKAALKDENNCLRSRIQEAEDIVSKTLKEFELAQKKIAELEGKIKFLEGQIDAYQYCMNCKR